MWRKIVAGSNYLSALAEHIPRTKAPLIIGGRE